MIVYGKALSQLPNIASKNLQAELAADRDYHAAKSLLFSTLSNRLMENEDRLHEIIKFLLSDHPNRLPPKLEAFTKSLQKPSFQDKLEQSKRKVDEAFESSLKKDLAMRVLENEKAQRLFLSLVKEVRETSGFKRFNTIVWETCGTALSQPGPASLVGDCTEIEVQPFDWNEESLRQKLGSGYDFFKDSAVSQEIAQFFMFECSSTANLQAEVGKRGFEWKRLPALEIKLMQQERDEALKYCAKVEQRLEEETKARKEVQARAQQVEYAAEADKKLENQSLYQINDLINFAEQNFPDIDFKKGHGFWENFVFLKQGITATKKEVCALRKDVDRKSKVLAIKEATILELQRTQGGLQETYRDEFTKPLQKKIDAKDKLLADKEREMIFASQRANLRAEELKSEIVKVKSQHEDTQQKLDKALREPDKFKAEWSGKVQKLHDKIRDLEKKLDIETTAHKTLRLDFDATVKDLNAKDTKSERFIEQQKEFVVKGTVVRNERDALRVRVQSLERGQAPDVAAEAKSDKKALQDSTARIAKLEEETRKLNQDRKVDEKTIRELSRDKADLKENLAVVEQVQDKIKQERDNALAAFEKEKEKVRMMGKDELLAFVEAELEEEKKKSAELDAKLASITSLVASLDLVWT